MKPLAINSVSSVLAIIGLVLTVVFAVLGKLDFIHAGLLVLAFLAILL